MVLVVAGSRATASGVFTSEHTDIGTATGVRSELGLPPDDTSSTARRPGPPVEQLAVTGSRAADATPSARPRARCGAELAGVEVTGVAAITAARASDTAGGEPAVDPGGGSAVVRGRAPPHPV